MSDHQNENSLRIAAYLENRLTPEEREEFKRSLSENDQLRLQYVDALMNRAGTGINAGMVRVPEDKKAVDGGGANDVEGGGVTGGEEVQGGRDAGAVGGGGNVTEEMGEVGGGGNVTEQMGEVGGGGHVTEEMGSVGGGGHAAEGAGGDAAEEAGGRERSERGGRETAEVQPEMEHQGSWETLGEQGAREAWEAGWPGGKKKTRGRFLGSGWMVGLTVLVLIIAGGVIYILTRHQAFWDRTVSALAADSGEAKKGTGVDTAARMAGNRGDSAVTGAGAGSAVAGTKAAAGAEAAAGKEAAASVANGSGGGGVDDSLYAKLYKPYMRGDDPVAVREFYQDYRTGNYAAVLAAGDSLVSGPTAAKYPTRNYMRLYKGLSHLATGDARDAVSMLEDVVLRTKPGDDLYDAARWYLALAWLKRGDVDPAQARSKALGLARDISRGFSRYREPAREMVRSLGP